MDVKRRNLMKGILAGGTLATFGIPRFTTAGITSAPGSGKARSCALLLGNTRVDDAFAKGVSAAYSACSIGDANVSTELAPLEVVKLKDGLLVEVEQVSELLAVSRGVRWIALMDDASAAVFTEIVRSGSARLLLRGSHASSANDPAHPVDNSPALRHLWASASPGHSAGALLASRLIGYHGSFSIVENHLGDTVSGGKPQGSALLESSKLPGFRSYLRTGVPPTHLHCSGLSPSEGCRLLGWSTAAVWIPFSESDKGTPYNQHGEEGWRPENWVEALGHAIAAAALQPERGEEREPWVSRGFVHSANGRQQDRAYESLFPEERLTSFVIDV